jgi:ADP-ribose pyrophosphatase YjhB (NUDIX family)
MGKTSRYASFDKHYVAIDSIIFGFDDDKLKLLLIKRKFEPCKGCWSLMGGFVGKEESLDDAAVRILEELTGLTDIYLEQLYAYGEVDRDLDARVISVAYYALININHYDEETGRRHGAHWVPIEDVPRLIFDHNIMVDKAMRRLRRKTIIQPIGFELLPEKFTLPQLQRLYEAIHQETLDKRNFRKKILSMGVLTRLNEKDKLSSKRGAYLYQFDKDKYDYLIRNGNLFVMK